jgi:hypothetical protein
MALEEGLGAAGQLTPPSSSSLLDKTCSRIKQTEPVCSRCFTIFEAAHGMNHLPGVRQSGFYRG